MAVRDAVSSNSRGELAPSPNTFQQPGVSTMKNPDTAMTDGVTKAMLKAQRETTHALKDPHRVRRHLVKDHGIANSVSPLSAHARQHTTGVMSQGHSVASSGALTHSSTDIDAGAANFSAEPSAKIYEFAGPHHVRSARGVAFFKEPLGTPITEAEYLGIKQGNATAKAQRAAVRAGAERVENTERAEKDLTHSDLLAARREARAKYPAGHPERLAAERAVRTSRRTEDYRSAKGGQAHVSDKKKKADAAKDPGFYSPNGPKKDAIPTVTAAELKARGIIPGGSKPQAPMPSLISRQQEVSNLTAGERSRYYAMRNAGVMHEKAMLTIRQAQARPKKMPVVTKLRTRRKKG